MTPHHRCRTWAQVVHLALLMVGGFGTVSINAAESAKCVASPADCETIAQVKSTWNAFTGHLHDNQLEKALELVAAQSQPMFKAVLFAPEATPASFVRSIDRFFVSRIDGSYVIAKLIIKRNDQPTMYTVVFSRQADGSWRLDSI